MRVPTRSTGILLLAGILAAGPAVAQEDQTKTGPASNNQAASGGLRAYLDPATGKLIDHPPFGRPTLEMSPRALERFSTSDFGLIERVLPNGLTIIDLKGRFRQGSVASVGKDGEIRVRRIGGEIFANSIGEAIQETLHRDESSQQARGNER